MKKKISRICIFLFEKFRISNLKKKKSKISNLESQKKKSKNSNLESEKKNSKKFRIRIVRFDFFDDSKKITIRN